MNTDPPKPKKMTSEEVQRMLADFYQEVERREQSLAHLDKQGTPTDMLATTSQLVLLQSSDNQQTKKIKTLQTH